MDDWKMIVGLIVAGLLLLPRLKPLAEPIGKLLALFGIKIPALLPTPQVNSTTISGTPNKEKESERFVMLLNWRDEVQAAEVAEADKQPVVEAINSLIHVSFARCCGGPAASKTEKVV